MNFLILMEANFVSPIRGKAKYLASATTPPLNMFFDLLYPLLFELFVLIPDPAFSQGLLDAFINAYLLSFSVRTLMLVVFSNSNSTQIWI